MLVIVIVIGQWAGIRGRGGGGDRGGGDRGGIDYEYEHDYEYEYDYEYEHEVRARSSGPKKPADQFYAMAKDLADRFDRRNGNDWYEKLLWRRTRR